MRLKLVYRIGSLVMLCAALLGVAGAQQQAADEEFGPVVRAYLGYLRAEQNVVDDRISRHEISAAYYRRNSNRIRALRQTAIKIARETGNDFMPELEAVTRTELGNIFEHPPSPETFRAGEIYDDTFRFIGQVRAGELFYIFVRLDPYEQAEVIERKRKENANGAQSSAAPEAVAPSPATIKDAGDNPQRAKIPR